MKMYKEMTVKFSQGVTPTIDQLQEIANSVVPMPDAGWNYDHTTGKVNDIQYAQHIGTHGTYEFRTNLSWNLITILEIKD